MAEGIRERNSLQNPVLDARAHREASEVDEKDKMLKEGGGFEVVITDLEASSVEMRAVLRCGNRFTPRVEGTKVHIAEDMSPAADGPIFRGQGAIQETAPIWEMVNDFVNDFGGYVDCVFVVLAKNMM